MFEYQDAAGLHARKEFRLDPQNYVIGFSASVMNGGMPLNPSVQWGPGLGDAGATSGGGSFFTGNYVQPPSAIFHRDGDVERLLPDDLREQPVHEGPFRFAGIDDHYFIAVAVNPGQTRVQYRPVTLPGDGETAASVAGSDLPFCRSRQPTSGSSSARSSSSNCAPWTRSWCARSTSASSRSSRCRCSVR